MMNNPQFSPPQIVVIPAVEVLPTDCGYVVRQHGVTVDWFGHHERAEADALAEKLIWMPRQVAT